MKNIFDYATKELSQDAFLRWVLCHCDDMDLSQISCKFVSLLTNKSLLLNREDVSKVIVRPQVGKIDIIVQINTVDGKRYLIAIEDKTSSKEHNQLVRYNEVIAKKYPHVDCVYRCYYKTEKMTKAERDRVIRSGWDIVEYNDIIGFWSQYLSSENLIIQQYAESIMSKQIIRSELKKLLREYQVSQTNEIASIKFTTKYCYIFPKKFKGNLMPSTNWKENRFWLVVCLESYQGLLWVYCGFKGGQRRIAIPGTFVESNWWKKEYATLEDDIGAVSDISTKSGRNAILFNLNRSITSIINASVIS